MKVRTHLMFQGDAVAAIALYKAVFSEFDVVSAEYYAENEAGPTGTLRLAQARFAGHDLLIIDSPPVHEFTFTPSVSLFIDFETETALDAAFTRLSEKGSVLMPLGDYGFSRRFGWAADRFGVSWQLNLP